MCPYFSSERPLWAAIDTGKDSPQAVLQAGKEERHTLAMSYKDYVNNGGKIYMLMVNIHLEHTLRSIR